MGDSSSSRSAFRSGVSETAAWLFPDRLVEIRPVGGGDVERGRNPSIRAGTVPPSTFRRRFAEGAAGASVVSGANRTRPGSAEEWEGRTLTPADGGLIASPALAGLSAEGRTYLVGGRAAASSADTGRVELEVSNSCDPGNGILTVMRT